MAGPAPDFPGFSYSWDQAQSLAAIMQPLLAAAAGASVSTPTQLAALGILVAKVIAGSRLRWDALKATQALAVLEQELLASTPIP